MEEGLKQRLVGAAVLVLLAVVFVPMLLDFPREAERAEADPPAPPEGGSGFSSRVVPLEEAHGVPEPAVPEGSGDPVLEQGAGDTVAAQSADAPPDSPPDSPPDASPDATLAAESSPPLPEGGDGAPSPDADVPVAAPEEEEPGAPAGWAAQLGSFADRRNAVVLRNRLRAKGYAAFTESATNDQGEVTRVLVGPEPTRDRTVSTIESLRRDTGLDAFVVRYPRG